MSETGLLWRWPITLLAVSTLLACSPRAYMGHPVLSDRAVKLNKTVNPVRENLFTQESFIAIRKRFNNNVGERKLVIFPGVAPRECWDIRKKPSLEHMLANEVGYIGGIVVPLNCLFENYSPDDLHKLAISGNLIASYIYSVLVIEEIGCEDNLHASYLRKLSDNGYAHASISIGNFEKACGSWREAIHRYSMAELQGFISARSYYDELIYNALIPK